MLTHGYHANHRSRAGPVSLNDLSAHPQDNEIKAGSLEAKTISELFTLL